MLQTHECKITKAMEYAIHDGVRLTGDLYFPLGLTNAPIVIAVVIRDGITALVGAGQGDGARCHHLLRGLHTLLRILDGELRDLLARIRVAIDPERHRVARVRFDERSGVA